MRECDCAQLPLRTVLARRLRARLSTWCLALGRRLAGPEVASRYAVTLQRDADVTVTVGHAVTAEAGVTPASAAAVTPARSETEIERVRRLARDRQRRKRERDRTARSVTPVTLAVAHKIEEEVDLLRSEVAPAPAADPSGSPEYQRKQGWCTSVMRRAEAAGILSRDGSAQLWGALGMMRPDRSLKNWGLSRKANDELDRLDRLLRDRGAAPAVRAQPGLMLPIPGGAAQPSAVTPAVPPSRAEYDPEQHRKKLERQNQAIAAITERKAG